MKRFIPVALRRRTFRSDPRSRPLLRAAYTLATLALLVCVPLAGAHAKGEGSGCAAHALELLDLVDFGPDAPPAPKAWRDWEHAGQAEMKKVPRAYFLERKAVGDPTIGWLEELGFRFDQDPVEAPPIGKIWEAYEASIRKRVASGRLKPEEVLLPRRVFESTWRSGVYRFLKWGDPIPADWEPVTTVLPTDVFLDMVAQGFFPIGEPAYAINGRRHTALQHDLGHFIGFMKNPKYMAALRKAYEKAKGQGHSFGEGSVGALRGLFAAESMATVPAKNRRELDRVLGFPPKRSGRYGVREIEKWLRKMAPEERARYLKTVYGSYERLLEPAGGTAADVILMKVLNHKENSAFTDQMVQSLGAMGASKAGSAELADIHDHARFLVALRESSRVAPEDWMLAAFDRRLDPNSRLHRFLCKSGVWKPGTGLHRAHCLGLAMEAPLTDEESMSPRPKPDLRKAARVYGALLREDPRAAACRADPERILQLGPDDFPLLEALASLDEPDVSRKLIELMQTKEGFAQHPRALEIVIESRNWDAAAWVLRKKEWAESPAGIRLLHALLRKASEKKLFRPYSHWLDANLMTVPEWQASPAFDLVQSWSSYLSDQAYFHP